MSKSKPPTEETPSETQKELEAKQHHAAQIEEVFRQAESALADLTRTVGEMDNLLKKARVRLHDLKGERDWEEK